MREHRRDRAALPQLGALVLLGAAQRARVVRAVDEPRRVRHDVVGEGREQRARARAERAPARERQREHPALAAAVGDVAERALDDGEALEQLAVVERPLGLPDEQELVHAAHVFGRLVDVLARDRPELVGRGGAGTARGAREAPPPPPASTAAGHAGWPWHIWWYNVTASPRYTPLPRSWHMLIETARAAGASTSQSTPSAISAARARRATSALWPRRGPTREGSKSNPEQVATAAAAAAMAEFAAVVPDEVFAVVFARASAPALLACAASCARARARALGPRVARALRALARQRLFVGASLRAPLAAALARADDAGGAGPECFALFYALARDGRRRALEHGELTGWTGPRRRARARARSLSSFSPAARWTMAFPLLCARRRAQELSVQGGGGRLVDRAGSVVAARPRGPAGPARRRRARPAPRPPIALRLRADGAVLAVNDARPFWGAPGAVAGRWRHARGARRARRARAAARWTARWTTSPSSASSR